MFHVLFRRSVLWAGVLLLLVGGLPTAGSTGASPDAPAQGQPASSDWIARVSEDIRRSEYHFSRQADGGWSAPNRAHGLRARLDESGVRLSSQTKGANPHEGGWELRIVLSAQGREGSLSAVPRTLPEAEGGRVAFRRGLLSEWYVNDEKGLEQGFTIEAPPRAGSATAPLILEMSLGGDLSAYPSEDGQAVLFKTAAGREVVRYSGLRVDDARGTRVEASLAVLPGRLQIRINDEGAAYPLTVDPLMTSPAWSAEGNQEAAALGWSVATAGDVNGDGYSDVIVGAPQFDNGQTDEGRAYVYHGSASGLATSPAWTAESDQAGAKFGRQVASAGDVNGDGFSDVIVGAINFDNGQTDEGRAFVYHGSSSGLATSAAWTAESDQASAFFGYSVATAGDVNGDGFSDVIISAVLFDNGQTNEGRAFVYHGSSSGLATSAAWTAESDQAEAWFGYWVATAGDVNGDGYSDVVVGAPQFDNGQTDEGRAYVYHGSSSGLAASAAWTAESNQAGAWFGVSTATAGDVDGGGFGDLIVGAPFFDNGQTDEGRAFVYQGSSSGLAASAGWTAEGNQDGARLGDSVATAGDVNGDGFSDVIVGASKFDNDQVDEGRAFVYQGSSTGLATSPAWTAEGNQSVANWFGYSVATAGDVNGDGFSDVIVGDFDYINGQTFEGGAWVYHGSAAGLSTSPGWTTEGNQLGALFGYSVATAGDVNGDGFSDVIVGAIWFDNGQTDEGRAFVYHGSASGLGLFPAWTAEGDQASALFGYSVATAGDVNGDGYSDVIVGAVQYDNGQTDEGRAFVYHGSSSGLATSAAWTAESNQASALFGYSVATAGDVNGDGFSDVIVGATQYDNGQTNEGRAFVYHGSSSGLATSAAWTAESNQASATFGRSVATAGDVNRDGFSDVIVGANAYDNGQSDEGRAFVYHGSSSGLATSSAWTAESNQASAYFGYSVATAGDVNGDGYSDVIVGAPLYDNGQSNEGRAFVYHGSSSGLATSAAWTSESNQAGADYAVSVATAGDVNGDGYSDAIVGAYLFDSRVQDEGRAFVYHGSASGLATSAAWTAEPPCCNELLAYSGYSVATAGDVNGDGFSDVIVSAHQEDDGIQGDEGRARVYYGNAGPGGLTRTPNQARSTGSALIALLGKSDSASSFRLRAVGRTPAGRGKVRVVWEVKPLGTAFDGTGLGQGTLTDTGTPGGSGSAVSLEETVSGLSSGTVYKWRVRIVSANTFYMRSPWFSLPYNNRTESDLRTP